MIHPDGKRRCDWAGTEPIYVDYHDTEWGVPVTDDRLLFAHLLLDGAQAGLSWITILKKREAYQAAFHRFDPEKIAQMDAAAVAKCMQNPGIVRNKQKIRAFVNNARAYLAIQDSGTSFSDYIWGFTNGRTIVNQWTRIDEVPPESPASRAMSKDLKKRGFQFVGPVICYAFMQASGLVNDHLVDCFRYEELIGKME